MSRVAALWETGRNRRQGSGFASTPGGVPFLTGTLTGAFLIVEAAFGADIMSTEPQTWNWVDITTDVRQADNSNISISPVGRSDETSQASPATCKFELANDAGNYTANHPASKWFPFVRRNTPIRVRLYINGAYYTRFQGYADGWVPTWDTSASLAVVTVSASGVLRRLNQGKNPIDSALYRSVLATNPVAYWTLEDGTDSTSAASALSGGNAMVIMSSGGVTTLPAFSTIDGPAGSSKLPNFTNTASLAALATVNGGVSPSTPWTVGFAFKVPTIPPAQQTYAVRVYSQTGTLWYYDMLFGPNSSNGIWLSARRFDGAAVNITTGVGVDDGAWHWFTCSVQQTGPDLSVTFRLDGKLVGSSPYTMSGQTMAPIATTLVSPFQQYALYPDVGHLAIWNGTTVADLTPVMNGHAGETTTARLARLCSERSVPLTITGSSTTAMGMQGTDTLINLLRECETTDDGLLYDGLGPGLGYIPREYRYNKAASMSPDMSADPPQVDDPFEPTDDDQRNRNVVTVNRKSGSSATYEDSASPVGTAAIQEYDAQITVNTQADDVLAARAAWEVNKGSVLGYRYPALNLDFVATPALIPGWLATGLSSRIDVLNVASKATQHPPGTVSLLLEGYAETLSPIDWNVTANCSPFEPWRVMVIEGADSAGWRVDSDGSTLATGALAGVTSLSVSVSDGYLWSTNASDYPQDIEVGGAQVTVTAVSGVSSPQTFTITPVTFPLKAGWTVSLWQPPTIAL